MVRKTCIFCSKLTPADNPPTLAEPQDKIHSTPNQISTRFSQADVFRQQQYSQRFSCAIGSPRVATCFRANVPRFSQGLRRPTGLSAPASALSPTARNVLDLWLQGSSGPTASESKGTRARQILGPPAPPGPRLLPARSPSSAKPGPPFSRPCMDRINLSWPCLPRPGRAELGSNLPGGMGVGVGPQLRQRPKLPQEPERALGDEYDSKSTSFKVPTGAKSLLSSVKPNIYQVQLYIYRFTYIFLSVTY